MAWVAHMKSKWQWTLNGELHTFVSVPHVFACVPQLVQSKERSCCAILFWSHASPVCLIAHWITCITNYAYSQHMSQLTWFFKVGEGHVTIRIHVSNESRDIFRHGYILTRKPSLISQTSHWRTNKHTNETNNL